MTDTPEASPTVSRWRTRCGVAGLIALVFAIWGFHESQLAQDNGSARAAAEREVVQLRGHLGDLEQRISELQQQAANQAAELRDIVKPDLPVSIAFRSRFFGAGLTATFRNTSTAQIELAAVFTNPATSEHKEMTLVLPPGGSRQVGRTQGWPFAAGERIALTNSEFRPLEITVPAK